LRTANSPNDKATAFGLRLALLAAVRFAKPSNGYASDSLRSHAVLFANQASLGQKGKLGAKRHPLEA